MANHPDPEEDFEGCINSILREVIAEDAGVPPHLKDRYYLKEAAKHLVTMLDLDAAQIMVSRACQKLAARCAEFDASIPEEFRWTEAE